MTDEAFQMVPKHPTSEMIESARNAHPNTYGWPPVTPEVLHYRAMLASAPRPPVAESGWLEIEFEVSPPLNAKTLLGWYEPTGEWNCIVGQSSFGWRNKTANNVSSQPREILATSSLPTGDST